jgi:hypothetical protein
VEWSELRKELIKSSYSKEKSVETLLGKIAKNERYNDDTYGGGRNRLSRWFPNPNLDAEELEKMFTPKEVCLQESSSATEYRLEMLGLENLDLSRIYQWLTANSELLKFKKERAVNMILLAEARKDNKTKSSLKELKGYLLKDLKDLEIRLEVGRYIRSQLIVCPWNTTEAYKDRVRMLIISQCMSYMMNIHTYSILPLWKYVTRLTRKVVSRDSNL